MEPAQLAEVDANGFLKPLGSGQGQIVATFAGDLQAELPFEIRNFEAVLPVNFPNQIIPFLPSTVATAVAVTAKQLAKMASSFRCSDSNHVKTTSI